MLFFFLLIITIFSRALYFILPYLLFNFVVCNVQQIVFFAVAHFSVLKYFFFSCRQQLLKVTFESPPISPKTPASSVKCKTPREKEQACKGSFLSNYFQTKLKTSPTKKPWLHSSFTQSGGEKETGGSHHSKKADLHSSSTLLAVKEEPTNAVEEDIQLLKSVNQEDTACNSHASPPQVAHASSPSKDIKPIIKGGALLFLAQSNVGTQCDVF